MAGPTRQRDESHDVLPTHGCNRLRHQSAHVQADLFLLNMFSQRYACPALQLTISQPHGFRVPGLMGLGLGGPDRVDRREVSRTRDATVAPVCVSCPVVVAGRCALKCHSVQNQVVGYSITKCAVCTGGVTIQIATRQNAEGIPQYLPLPVPPPTPFGPFRT